MSHRELNGPKGPEVDEHFGAFLRRAREARGMTIADVAQRTRIQEHQLRPLEESRLDALPAEVFVRGFVRAHARAVGADADEAMRRLDRAVAERRELAKRPPVLIGDAAQGPVHGDSRKRVGVALVVLLILIVATITLSLLLHRSSSAGGGLSLQGGDTGGAARLDHDVDRDV